MPVLKFGNVKLSAIKHSGLDVATEVNITSSVGQDLSWLKINIKEAKGPERYDGIVLDIPHQEKQLSKIDDSIISIRFMTDYGKGPFEAGFGIDVHVASNQIVKIEKLDLENDGGSWLYDIGLKDGEEVKLMYQNWCYGINMYWKKDERAM